jgi:hypothetical protein
VTSELPASAPKDEAAARIDRSSRKSEAVKPEGAQDPGDDGCQKNSKSSDKRADAQLD